MRKIMITGGLGFIGANLVRHWMRAHPKDYVMVLDSMTYAANPSHAFEVAYTPDNVDRFAHLYCDISDKKEVRRWFQMMRPTHVIHLAAESHVCRSIDGPKDFIHTNVLGTFNLLEAFRELENGGRFLHVSTDEVYGEALEGKFDEGWRYDPKSPYAASKAASDHLVRAWAHTYGMDVVITNCSNNFGPNQHVEKLIPKAIVSALTGKAMTVYGDGSQIRDWLYVEDHCKALDIAFNKGKPGESYCIGGNNELTNRQVLRAVEAAVSKVIEKKIELNYIFTEDRPTDDRRYAINTWKIENKLGWTSNPAHFEDNLLATAQWYISKCRKEKA